MTLIIPALTFIILADSLSGKTADGYSFFFHFVSIFWEFLLMRLPACKPDLVELVGIRYFADHFIFAVFFQP